MLLVDILKGVAAIILVRWLWSWIHVHAVFAPPPNLDRQDWAPWAVGLAGLAVLLGHSRSVWLRFSGGKWVATGLGVILAISWPVGLGALAAFGVAMAIFRIVSLGSIVAATVAIILVCGLVQPLPYRLLVIAGRVYVVSRHRANTRLLEVPRVKLEPIDMQVGDVTGRAVRFKIDFDRRHSDIVGIIGAYS